MRRFPFSFPACLAIVVGGAAAGVGCHRSSSGPSAEDRADANAGDASSAAADASKSSAFPIPSASVEAQINPEKLPAYEGPTGSVEGTVFVKGPPAPDVGGLPFRSCPAAIDTYGKLFRAGPANADGVRPLADALVMVTGYKGYYLPEKDPAHRVTIRPDCGYPERTIALTFGQRLEVANDSKLPFAPALAGSFQPAVMIAPPLQSGDPIKLYPPQPGHYALTDNLQPFVREDVYVLRHPLHAVTDRDGHYRIDGVPPGALNVVALLHALRSEVKKDVTVRANVVEHVDIVLTYSPSDAGEPIPHVIP